MKPDLSRKERRRKALKMAKAEVKRKGLPRREMREIWKNYVERLRYNPDWTPDA